MKYINSVKFSKSLDKVINTYTALSGLSKVGKNYNFLSIALGTQVSITDVVVPARTKMQLICCLQKQVLGHLLHFCFSHKVIFCISERRKYFQDLFIFLLHNKITSI